MKKRKPTRRRRKARRRLRKQPRRLTPPLVVRDSVTGAREIYAVDESTVTAPGQTLTSGRLSAVLKLGPGLAIEVGSVSINKRRHPLIMVTARDCPAAPAPIVPASLATARATMGRPEILETRWRKALGALRKAETQTALRKSRNSP